LDSVYCERRSEARLRRARSVPRQGASTQGVLHACCVPTHHDCHAAPARNLAVHEAKVAGLCDVVERLERLRQRAVDVGSEHVHKAPIHPAARPQRHDARATQARISVSWGGWPRQEPAARRHNACAPEPLRLLRGSLRRQLLPLIPAVQFGGQRLDDEARVVELLAVHGQHGHLRRAADACVSSHVRGPANPRRARTRARAPRQQLSAPFRRWTTSAPSWSAG
jgi:hypothetical protein